MKARLVLLVALFAAGCYAEQQGQDSVEINEADAAQERLIALYSTFTLSRISSTTTTVAFSCNIVPAAATACKRRRRKRSARPATDAIQLASPEMAAPELSSSLDRSQRDTSEASGRLFFTIWTTSFTTLTTTFMSTNFSTTVSYTLLCTAPGQSLLPLC
ncbi:uncharacterized protein LOC119103510 [Pollicipes pollicipes]|uniref:uncharacterized protein LOC119103510 n=1 Tax=Pollicipes pollicipes TaxID=41117 RepID=UPI001884D04B|nr:uncharacterized protein LOC119103510 [Pollicipes pollicipes]